MYKKLNLNHLLRLVPSFTLYFLGLLSLFVIDLMVGKIGNEQDIAFWAFFKSILLISSFVALKGFDQTLVRYPNSLNLHNTIGWLKFALPIVLISSALTWLVKPEIDVFTYFCAILSVSLLCVLSGYYRGRFELVIAQIFSNIWKLSLAIIFITIYVVYENANLINIIQIFFVMFLFVALLIFMKIIFETRNKQKVDLEKTDDITYQAISKLGVKFFIMGLTLNVSVNIEQIIVNSLGTELESVQLFGYVTSYGAILIVFSGFFGFVLAPIVRTHSVILYEQFNKFIFSCFTVTLILAFVTSFVGDFLLNIFYADKVNAEDQILKALVIAIFVFKFLYVIPSAAIGFSAPAKIFDKYVLYNILFIFVFVASFGILFYVFDTKIVISIAIASLVNWILRVVTGILLIRSVIRFNLSNV